MGFSRQEIWSGLPCPPPGDLPNPGIEPTSFVSPALAGSSLPRAPPKFSKPSDKGQIWGSEGDGQLTTDHPRGGDKCRMRSTKVSILSPLLERVATAKDSNLKPCKPRFRPSLFSSVAVWPWTCSLTSWVSEVCFLICVKCVKIPV